MAAEILKFLPRPPTNHSSSHQHVPLLKPPIGSYQPLHYAESRRSVRLVQARFLCCTRAESDGPQVHSGTHKKLTSRWARKIQRNTVAFGAHPHGNSNLKPSQHYPPPRFENQHIHCHSIRNMSVAMKKRVSRSKFLQRLRGREQETHSRVKDVTKDHDGGGCDDKETTNLENQRLDVGKSLRSSSADMIQSHENLNLQSLQALSEIIEPRLLFPGHLLLTVTSSRAKTKQKVYSRRETNYLTIKSVILLKSNTTTSFLVPSTTCALLLKSFKFASSFLRLLLMTRNFRTHWKLRQRAISRNPQSCLQIFSAGS